MPQRRGRRHYVPEPKKSVEKNIVRISTEPIEAKVPGIYFHSARLDV